MVMAFMSSGVRQSKVRPRSELSKTPLTLTRHGSHSRNRQCCAGQFASASSSGSRATPDSSASGACSLAAVSCSHAGAYRSVAGRPVSP